MRRWGAVLGAGLTPVLVVVGLLQLAESPRTVTPVGVSPGAQPQPRHEVDLLALGWPGRRGEAATLVGTTRYRIQVPARGRLEVESGPDCSGALRLVLEAEDRTSRLPAAGRVLSIDLTPWEGVSVVLGVSADRPDCTLTRLGLAGLPGDGWRTWVSLDPRNAGAL